jgi:hypothetical protein
VGDQDHRDIDGNVGCASLLRGVSVCGTAVAVVAETSPSAVNSATKAVTMVVHSFRTVFRAMAPHFRVGRFAYFPHDVYGGREVVDLRPWRVDVLMNTTRMEARASEMFRNRVREPEERAK